MFEEQYFRISDPFDSSSKRHKRNTMQALDRSLDYLEKIQDGSCSAKELSIEFFINGGIMA